MNFYNTYLDPILEDDKMEVYDNSNDLDLSTLYIDNYKKRISGNSYGSVVQYNGRDVIENFKNLCLDMKFDNINLPISSKYVVLSKFKDVISKNNNGSELLAFLIGLRIAKYTGKVKTIKCDFKYIFKWLDLNNKMDKRLLSTIGPVKLKYINECILLLHDFKNKGGSVENYNLYIILNL